MCGVSVCGRCVGVGSVWGVGIYVLCVHLLYVNCVCEQNGFIIKICLSTWKSL